MAVGGTIGAGLGRYYLGRLGGIAGGITGGYIGSLVGGLFDSPGVGELE